MSLPEKDFTNNEQEREPSTIQAVAPPKKGSCRLGCVCTIASVLILLTAPNFVMLFAYTIINLNGSLAQLFDFLSLQSPQGTLGQIWWPYVVGNHEVWTIIGVFISFEVLLMIILPGHHYTGSATPKGNVPHYKDNGLLAFFFTVVAFAMLVYYNIFNPSIIYDNFMYLIGALNLVGLGLSIVLFVKGKYLPSSTDITDAGLISGFFEGTELHPQILRCDLKLLINSRFGMMGWALLLLSYAYKQYQDTGEISDSMGVTVSLQLIYITKFLYWEQGYTRTLDIIHDKAGFRTVSDCFVNVCIKMVFGLGYFLFMHAYVKSD